MSRDRILLPITSSSESLSSDRSKSTPGSSYCLSEELFISLVVVDVVAFTVTNDDSAQCSSVTVLLRARCLSDKKGGEEGEAVGFDFPFFFFFFLFFFFVAVTSQEGGDALFLSFLDPQRLTRVDDELESAPPRWSSRYTSHASSFLGIIVPNLSGDGATMVAPR
jgi:hypothetical protein